MKNGKVIITITSYQTKPKIKQKQKSNWQNNLGLSSHITESLDSEHLKSPFSKLLLQYIYVTGSAPRMQWMRLEIDRQWLPAIETSCVIMLGNSNKTGRWFKEAVAN